MGLIWVIFNLNIYAGERGKMNVIIDVLIDIEREIREDNVFVMEAKTHTLNVHLEQHFFLW